MQKINLNNEQFSPPCVDNSTFSKENEQIINVGSANKEKITESTEKAEQNSKNASVTGIEGQIERDFSDFEVIYPNISKNSLLTDESLRIFAEGKESKPLSVVYAQFKAFVAKIEENAIKQEQIRQNNANSSVGGLSGTKSGDDGYFTKEQVLKMSQSEIKRNYKRIRESQARW